MSRILATLLLTLGLPLLASVEDKKGPSRPVNLNTATATELMQLPKIGAKTAERILAFRKQHGAFRRIEEVMNVKGIGEKSFARLRPFLTVGATAPAPRSGK